MDKPTLKILLLTPVLLSLSALAYGQELSLFEPVAVEDVSVRAELQQNREQQAAPGVPSFTLVGTSRIGSRYSATLAASNGKVVVVNGSPGSVQEIPDHPGYRIVDIGSRRVSIANPGGIPCIATPDKGVACDANGVSLLSLATAAPVAAPAGAVVDPAAPAPESDIPENPFAAALRAAAQNEANARGDTGNATAAERFQPRRIAPEDVPPGMRVVRTPFGDRLVEQ